MEKCHSLVLLVKYKCVIIGSKCYRLCKARGFICACVRVKCEDICLTAMVSVMVPKHSSKSTTTKIIKWFPGPVKV